MARSCNACGRKSPLTLDSQCRLISQSQCCFCPHVFCLNQHRPNLDRVLHAERKTFLRCPSWALPPRSRRGAPPNLARAGPLLRARAGQGRPLALVAIGARFQDDLGREDLLLRIGAVSRLAGIRYWSMTHHRWRTLIAEAHAVTAMLAGARRSDFTQDELTTGAVVYFEQEDNLSGTALYRLHISEATPNRIVFDIENASSLRYFLMPVLRVGEMQSISFLERESDHTWRYYSIVRTGKSARALTLASPASSINRAVAFYRFLAGIPTDQEPPAAR